jgi:phosphoribosylanthranilate isomerase
VTTPRVQIYTMQSVEEARAVAACGVDHIGVTPASSGLPGEITFELASEICRAVVGEAKSVALTVEIDLSSVEEMARAVRPDILHLCGPAGALEPDKVAELRSWLPGVPIMQAIAITGSEAVDMALSYEPVVDYLILDSVDPAIAGVGAAGAIHDWKVSAAIVEAVEVPVILAGGLSPQNVAAALAAVQPWAVDSLTHTNRQLPGGGFRKDVDLVGQFVAAARGKLSP